MTVATWNLSIEAKKSDLNKPIQSKRLKKLHIQNRAGSGPSSNQKADESGWYAMQTLSLHFMFIFNSTNSAGPIPTENGRFVLFRHQSSPTMYKSRKANAGRLGAVTSWCLACVACIRIS